MCRMNTRQVKSSASKETKELSDAILPLWSNSLDNVKQLPGKWVTGTTSSQLKVDSVIEEYSLSLPCDFVRSHPSTIRNCEKSRILWQMKDIPFSGVPFSVVSHHVLKCSFAMNYNSKKRRKISHCDGPELDEDEACVEDASLPPRVAVKGRRNCPAKICVKKIKRYPSYSLPTTATKQEKISELQSLKAEIENGARVEEETVYWLGLPLASVHNHTFRGRDRLVHRRVREKILELVKEGVTSPEVVLRILREHVSKVFENWNHAPRLDDEAYYPSLRNIGHVIYNYRNRKRVGVGNEGVKSEDQLSSKVRYKNTLQEVVEEFCSDSIGDILETSPDPPSAVVDLRNKIQERLGQISQLSQSVNDEKRLSEMLEYFDRFLVDSEDRSVNGYTRLVDADSTASFPPKTLNKSLPLELIPNRNPSSHMLAANWSYTKPQGESYLTCIPGSEAPSSETNQIVPCPSYEPSHHVTYALMDASPAPFQNILEQEIQPPNSLLPSSTDSPPLQLPPPAYDSPQLPPIPTAKFVYHIQQLPAIENDSPSYVSL